jgi:DNA-binding PadR family transcriptional regulator
MEQLRLSPIEYGVLFMLMSEGRPLKESAEIRQIHGLAMKKAHRDRLKDHGLIKSSSVPYIHRLTKKGEEWVKRQFTSSASIPAQSMVPFGAVAAVFKRLSDRQDDAPPAGENKNDGDELSQHIATAAWSEADEALGEALQAIPRIQRAIEKLAVASGAAHAEQAKQARLAANLVFQAVRHAARKRELWLGSEPGAEAAFDPVQYYSDDHLSYGEQVRVVKPPVIRGQGTASVVVRVGEAAALGK